MALAVNIDDLVNARTVESVRIEFKRGWNPFDILRTVCAFTNDIDELGGGYIIIGIQEEKGMAILPPHGIDHKDIDRIQREFFNLCKDKLDPNIFPSIEVVEFQGKFIVVIWIATGEQRPYFASNSLGKWSKMSIFVRHGSITKEADKNQEKQLRELATYKHFDDRINNNASIDDLDLGLIQSYLLEIKSDLYFESLKIPLVEIATKMQIARGPKENIKPLNVGLLMFCKEPHRFFEGCKTNLIEFEDEVGIKYSEKVFTGPVHVQIRDIMNYLKNNTIKQYVNKSPNKAETDTFYNYPFQALEEVVVNAMYHRSYEEVRANEIRIYKFFKKAVDNAEDKRRIEVRSYPGPLSPIDSLVLSNVAENPSIIQTKLNSRKYRNIKLGDWLKRIRLAELFSTGFPTIVKSLLENNSPKPFFHTDDSKSEFLVIIRSHEDTPINGASSSMKMERIVLSGLQQSILETIKNEPMEYSTLINIFKENISNEIELLKQNELLGSKLIGSTKLLFITARGVDILKVSF